MNSSLANSSPFNPDGNFAMISSSRLVRVALKIREFTARIKPLLVKVNEIGRAHV